MLCVKRPKFSDKYVEIFRKILWKPQFMLSHLFLGNIPFLRQLQQLDDEKNPNDKLTKLQFASKSSSWRIQNQKSSFLWKGVK